jgi:hypothetical protein
MSSLPTPISVLESYFDNKLTVKDMSFWKKVPDDTWVDFAKTYLAQMEEGFTAQAMADRIEGQKIRLYFDHRFGEDYDRAIAGRYTKTPLLGVSQYPPDGIDYLGEGLVQALAPLGKHLLVADELYLTDSFYRCFDFVADSYDRNRWRENPNVESGVRLSIGGIQRWLPILAGLRDLITSGAINFFPYYVIPSFTEGYRGTDLMSQLRARLDIPWDPQIKPIGEGGRLNFSHFFDQPPKVPHIADEPRLDCEAAVEAWINARLLGLDPVFANERTWRWASGIKFHEEAKTQVTTDLMSIDILPLGEKKGLSVKDIVSMRKGEESFQHIRDTLIGCKDYIRTNVSETASSEFVTKTCREYIRDTLDPQERFKTIKFLDNNLFAGTALSVAIGALFVTANPFVGLLVPAALTPKAFLAIKGAFDPRVRASIRLEALL